MSYRSLSKQELKQFDTHGYILLKNFLSPEEVLKFKETMKEVCSKNQSYYEPGDLLKHGQLGEFIYNEKLVNVLSQLFGRKPVYFGDSSFYYNKYPIRGNHRDEQTDPYCFLSDERYPIIRCLFFTQEHLNNSGGLKIQPKTHKYVYPRQYFNLLKDYLKNRKDAVLPPLRKISHCPYKSVTTGIGDLIVWDFRLIHSPWTRVPKFFPKISLHPALENKLPSFLFKKDPENRSNVSATFGVPSKEMSRYIKYTGERDDYREFWENCGLRDPEKVKLLESKGLEVNRDALKYAGLI